MDENLSIRSIAELLKDDMTGADIYSICSNAWLSAVRRTIIEHQEGDLTHLLKPEYPSIYFHFCLPDDSADEELTSDDVIVELGDFKAATLKFVPSINKSDMEYFNKLRANYSLEQ